MMAKEIDLDQTGKDIRIEALYLICKAFEESSLNYVFLRGYEELPITLPNDADFLFDKGDRNRAISIVTSVLRKEGWEILKQVEFSPVSVTYYHGEVDNLVIDFFEHLEWHYYPYIEGGDVLKEAVDKSGFMVPSPEHAAFMNVFNRLLYSGEVRSKHRELYGQLDPGATSRFERMVRGSFGREAGESMMDLVVSGDWRELEKRADEWRRSLKKRKWTASFVQVLKGGGRYGGRVFSRLVKPPGVFIVFEGADGVGKSSVMRNIMDSLPKVIAVKDPVMFHWKPSKGAMTVSTKESIGVDPRAQLKRNMLVSIPYLFFHWLGFWRGWLMNVYPRLSRNQLVVGDRYIYDMYFDPARFRLNVPDWLLRLMTVVTPGPDLVISMTAPAELIYQRKQELQIEEIEAYQRVLSAWGKKKKWVIELDASQSIEHVSSALIESIRKRLKEL